MKLIKKIFFSLPLRMRIFFRESKGLIKPNELISINRKLNRELRIYESKDEKGLEIKDGIETWYKSFRSFCRAQPKEYEVAIEFFKSNIKILKLSEVYIDDSEVILLCVVKNDLLKLKKMIKHHRRIGVRHFAILDNGSEDNTIEWLKLQKDVDLFYTNDKYTTNKRESWINRIIAYYGLNKWYLIVDSDELFVYSGMEEKDINLLIKYCTNNKIFRMRSLMIDMYSKDSFYLQKHDKEYIEECKYFDLDSYKYQERDYLDLITGGPRGRIFNQNAWLTKYPLCYFVEGDIQGKSHFLFPYKKNKNTKCFTALLHYKFLPSDIEKYRKIASDGSYFNGSIQYKNYMKYIDSDNGLSFINEKSQEYINSNSIYKLSVLDKLDI